MGTMLIILGALWVLLSLFFLAALVCSAKKDPADFDWDDTNESEDKSALHEWCEKALGA